MLVTDSKIISSSVKGTERKTPVKKIPKNSSIQKHSFFINQLNREYFSSSAETKHWTHVYLLVMLLFFGCRLKKAATTEKFAIFFLSVHKM